MASTIAATDTGWLVSIAVLMMMLLWGTRGHMLRVESQRRELKKPSDLGRMKHLCNGSDSKDLTVCEGEGAHCSSGGECWFTVGGVLHPPVTMDCHRNGKAPF